MSRTFSRDYFHEVLLGNIAGVTGGIKYGRNSDIDTVSTPEDIWEGGGTYTGFNAITNENLAIESSSAADTGSLVSSGTATGGSATTLVDSSADFVSDGVSVGDVLLNDTQGIHGIVSAVATTTLTLHAMNSSNPLVAVSNNTSDTYRVASTSGTGAAVLYILHILDEDYNLQTGKFVILNGTTPVTVTVNAMRCSRAFVILAGSGGTNAGIITINQATTTTNVFAGIPVGFANTLIGCYTVPAGKTLAIKRYRIGLSRSSGASGSATCSFRARSIGEVFRSLRAFELTTEAAVEFTSLTGDLISEKTDIKFTVDSVSDNNSVIEGAFEYLTIDN